MRKAIVCKHHFISLILLFISNQILFGQNKVIDSLKLLLDNCSVETARIDLITLIDSVYYNQSDIQQAMDYAELGIALAEKINYKNGIARNCLYLGRIYFELGKYQDAENYEMRALILYKELQNKPRIAVMEANLSDVKRDQDKYAEALSYANSAKETYVELNMQKYVAMAELRIAGVYQAWGKLPEALLVYSEALVKAQSEMDSINIVNILTNMGMLYEAQGNMPKALENYIHAMRYYESKGNKINMAKINDLIGNMYSNQKDTTEAMKYYNKALDIAKSMEAKDVISAVLGSMGIMEKEAKNYSAAMNYYMESLKLWKEMNSKTGILINLKNIGELSFLQGHHKEAIKYYEEAMDISKEIGDQWAITDISNLLGKLYVTINQPETAKKYFLQALPLAKEMRNFSNLADAEQGLYEVSLANNNYQEALNHYKLFTEYKDSIFDSEKSKQLAEVKEKFESELKDRQIKVQSLELGEQKRTKNYLIAFFGLAVLISFLIYREYYNRQRIKLQNLRNKIASDLHDDVGSTLSSISIFSQIAQRRPSEVQSLLQTIEESSKKMLDAMADIVWTIKPENDQFEKIILRMRSFAYELLGAKQIEFRFVVDDKAGKINIPMDARRNLYLIFKEATNNMVKYSNAANAEFAIKEQGGKLIMNIQDDGIGFDNQQEYQGNGLKNMYARAKEIGASLSVNSNAATGTQIELTMNI